MGTHTGTVMTLANSIIGVGILSMPFCFQKCGIILSIVLLIISNYITRISCHYLIKAAFFTKRRNFEFLAFYSFGTSGKLMVELFIIGYLIGTCIAYYVVVGDLGPQIIAKMLNLMHTTSLRSWVMLIVTIFCVIPLGLLKNIDSLSAVCTASIGFYICLVVKIIAESKSHLSAGDWYQHVTLWEPSGVLQCLPIFSMALSCQMQLFEVFETIPNASLEKMNEIVKSATATATGVYILVGFFGYVAFCTQDFTGNILLSFSQSLTSDAIKIGFVISVAFSFPLVIFPCRASLYSLLFRRGHIDAAYYIPEFKFRSITVFIVCFSLVIGILIPSIELVIGLIGSTIGVAICIMFPASCFIKIFKRDSTEKLLAKIIVVCGFLLMILGTYANLNAIDEKKSGPILNILSEDVIVPTIITDKPNSNSLLNQIKGNLDTKEEKIKEKIEINFKVDKPLEIEADSTIEKENKNSEQNKSPVKDIPQEQVSDSKEKIESKKENVEKSLIDKKNVINKDAILKEENEIAVEQADSKKIKEELNEMVNEIKRQNEETQKLVLEKFEEIVGKIEKSEKEKKDETISGNESNGNVNNHDLQSNEKIVSNETDSNIKVKLLENNQDQILTEPKENNLFKTGDNIPNNVAIVNAVNDSVKQLNPPAPISYKVGEIINQNFLDNKFPVPIPIILSNLTIYNTSNNVNSDSQRHKEQPILVENNGKGKELKQENKLIKTEEHSPVDAKVDTVNADKITSSIQEISTVVSNKLVEIDENTKSIDNVEKLQEANDRENVDSIRRDLLGIDNEENKSSSRNKNVA